MQLENLSMSGPECVKRQIPLTAPGEQRYESMVVIFRKIAETGLGTCSMSEEEVVQNSTGEGT